MINLVLCTESTGLWTVWTTSTSHENGPRRRVQQVPPSPGPVPKPRGSRQRQRVVIAKPAIISPKPTARFQRPIDSIGSAGS